jgi:aryl-alcohol dehydrogenase-like predicted oxidoreductase
MTGQSGDQEFRQFGPRLSAENLTSSQNGFARFVAREGGLGVVSAQLALAGCCTKVTLSLSICGILKSERVDENAKAIGVRLDTAVPPRTDELARTGLALGAKLSLERASCIRNGLLRMRVNESVLKEMHKRQRTMYAVSY